jgi:hypothetical protein
LISFVTDGRIGPPAADAGRDPSWNLRDAGTRDRPRDPQSDSEAFDPASRPMILRDADDSGEPSTARRFSDPRHRRAYRIH